MRENPCRQVQRSYWSGGYYSSKSVTNLEFLLWFWYNKSLVYFCSHSSSFRGFEPGHGTVQTIFKSLRQ